MELAIFVSPIIDFLTTQALTHCKNEIALVCSFKSELEKLYETLKLIEAVLQDAEEQQVRNRLVKLWLEKLKFVAYDAEDIFQELQYEHLRRKMENVSNCLRFFPGSRYNIARKIKDVNQKLDGITKEMEKFNFISQLGRTSGSSLTVLNSNRSETSSHINDSAAVVGRKNDLSEILDLLKQEKYSVVRITGMGGLGKTTLAQLVYADDNLLKDHFVVKKWVSMYGKSSKKEIFLDLLQSNIADRHLSLDIIEETLKAELAVGKSLIVLDDVWINQGIDVKELLKDLLSVSCKGSKILMTMRSAEDIPPMTDCQYFTHQLKGLPDDDCWSIIKKIAFGHGGAEETATLINIGVQIAVKCGGLPLAAKTLGGLLYSKKNDAEGWLSTLQGLPADEEIMSILKFSYDHLSPYVKRCFSYCSIFPKGYVFLKKELVRMWMAEGFLISPQSASPETNVGNEYFKILLFNSFFQDEQKNKWGDIKSCRMHDLVHDLAISVAGSESRMVNTNAVSTQSFRRLGIQVADSGDDAVTPSEIIKASKKLRTLVFSGFNHLEEGLALQIFNLSLLRVLNLSHTGIQELPQSICKLKHLRYLDLSYTGIVTFPMSFKKLYNLQTLRLQGCSLKELPKDMRKLIGLEYLTFNTRYLTGMPREVSKLSKLKELSTFVVGTGKDYGIEELKDLNLLGGKLSVENLGRVTVGKKANLMGKKDIIHLQLRWEKDNQQLRWDSQSCIDPDRIIKDAEVMNDLQPHPNLKKLLISDFGGSKFPRWMSASIHLPNLVYITLSDCPNCEHLPALGGLQSLRYVYMEGLSGIKQIGNEFYPSNKEAIPFPCLVELRIIRFINLEEWLGDEHSSASSFPSLKKLEIQHCSQLSTTPTKFPSLKKLNFSIHRQTDPNLKYLSPKLLWGVLQSLLVSGCDAFVGFLPDNDEQHLPNNFLSEIEIFDCPSLTSLPADLRGLNSLTYLAIERCSSLKSLPDGIQYLPALERLILGGFSEELTCFPFPAATGQQYFVSLCELKICGWPTLTTDVLPDQLQLLTSLRCFTIRGFPCLLSLPEWFGELSSLHILSIEDCSMLEHLPSKEQILRLTSLECLDIRSCRLLLERCRSPNEEWHKIAHLKQVNGSSSSLLNHITRDADMNLELLARRSGIFSNQNKEKRWIDSFGRICFMLLPRSINIAWAHVTYYWTWLSYSIIEPSASGDVEIEVPELLSVCWLDVHGKVDMSKLSRGVKYEVVFVVMFQERSYGWDIPVDLCLELPDGQRLVKKANLEKMPKSKWIEIHVGDFETPQQPGNQEKEVNFRLFEHEKLNGKAGLVIEGAIVRPKKY